MIQKQKYHFNFYALPLLLLAAIWQATPMAAQPHYPAADIPAHLLKNADIVVREHELAFTVLNKGEGRSKEHKVFTILNEAGAKYAELAFSYSKLVEIDDIYASVYDANGKLVRNLKKKDIQDVKPPEYYVNDSRMKMLSLPARAYPYTIEYFITEKYNGLMFYPVFEPQENRAVSVQKASFEVIMPPGLEVRVKAINVPAGAQKGDLKWEFQNLPAVTPEPYTPSGDQELCKIITAPTLFTLENYDGDMRTWASYGQFLNRLNESRQTLSPETKVLLKKLVANCPDTLCKVQRVYEYMQSVTRYFYVGYGIGGWQPTQASEVDQHKYGDCKGLSNYMIAMLEAVGVTARYAIIRATEDEQLAQHPDFPNAWFNHAIACVPLQKDTIWLECTSQTESCGFTGTHTDDRPALLVTPEGGYLVRTPRYDERQNLIRRKTEIALALDGSAKIQSDNQFQGIAQEIVAQLAEFPAEYQKKYLYELLNINDFQIDTFTLKREKGRLPAVQQHLALSLPKLATTSGKRLFLPLSLLCLKPAIPPADSTRRFSVQAHARGITEDNQISVSIPEGYRLEGAFAPVSVQNVFGRFEVTVSQEPNRLLIHRTLVLNSRIQPKTQFPVLFDFLKTIAKTDKMKLVLVKTT
jgi:transglutaminase-like putative cysteine protease